MVNMAARSSPPTDDMDFLGNGSMMDLEIKMGDLDKVLEEISQMDGRDQKQATHNLSEGEVDPPHKIENTSTDIETGEKTKSIGDKDTDGGLTQPSFNDSMGPDYSDDEIIDDSGVGNEGLAQMQAELLQAEKDDIEKQQQRQERNPLLSAPGSTVQDRVEKEELVAAIAVKPTQECPVGMSMKTSKGVTTIVGILDTGLLKDSRLRAGMELIQVNGVQIKNAKHARHLIQASAKRVKILAVDRVHSTTQNLQDSSA